MSHAHQNSSYIIMIYCRIACKYLEYPNEVTSKGANLIRLNNLLHLNFTRSVSKVPFNLERPNIIQCRAVLFYLPEFLILILVADNISALTQKNFFLSLAFHLRMIIYYIHNSFLFRSKKFGFLSICGWVVRAYFWRMQTTG